MSNEDRQFVDKIAQEISRITGNQLGEKQRSMVESRLTRRLRDLNLSTFKDYWEHFSKCMDEQSRVISLLTTHHTFFFREFAHFEFVRSQLPFLVEMAKLQGRKKIKVWTAASSQGQEAYSLAMLLDEELKKIDPTMDYEIFGSDVDPECVKMAENGVYRWLEIQKVPSHYVSAHWQRGKGKIAHFVKAKESIKKKCRFKVINLLELDRYNSNEKFDIIFCRNVFIYFEQKDVKSISEHLLKSVYAHGFLITGLSESLVDLGLKIEHLGKSIYTQNVMEQPKVLSTENKKVRVPEPRRPIVLAKEKVLDVLCVDDSPTVLKVLSKILNEDNGFRIKATAKNGLEAAELIKNEEFDVMTLDIHMPEMNGIEYLETHYKEGHPPVVMISSVSADNADFAYKALEFGAADYVEKPDASNLATCADQIRAKLKTSFFNKDSGNRKEHELQKSFSRRPIIFRPDEKLRIIVANYKERKKIWKMLGELKSSQPPTLLLMNGPQELLDPFVEDTKRNCREVEKHTPDNQFHPGKIIVATEHSFSEIHAKLRGRSTVSIVLGEPTKKLLDLLNLWKGISIIGEDKEGVVSEEYKKLCRLAVTVTPATSFIYESDRLLSNDDKENAA